MPLTFNVTPEGWSEIDHATGGVTNPSAGAIKTGRFTQGEAREFLLVWDTASSTEKTSIEDFLANTYGGAESMAWTPPGESDELRVKFLPGEAGYSRERISAKAYRIRVGFIELPEFRTPSQIP